MITKPITDRTENTQSAPQKGDTEAPVRKTRSNPPRSAAQSTKKDSTEATEAPKFKAAKTRVFSASSEDMTVSTETTWSTEQTAVWAFGRALAYLFEDGYAGFLILDHAERLLSLSSSRGTAERNNFLSQLLLLPRVAGINLTVIVVTNSLLLEHSREYIQFERGVRYLDTICWIHYLIPTSFATPYCIQVSTTLSLHRRHLVQLLLIFNRFGFISLPIEARVSSKRYVRRMASCCVALRLLPSDFSCCRSFAGQGFSD
jgi:hypothetical protein